MNIHIDFRARDFYKHDGRRIMPLHQQSLVTMKHRVAYHFVAHKTVIDESHKITSVGKRGRRGTQVSTYFQQSSSRRERDQVSCDLAPQNLVQPVHALTYACVVGDDPAVMGQAKVYVRMR